MLCGPCVSRMPRSRVATKAMASFQVTARHSDPSRIIGSRTRSGEWVNPKA